MPCAHCSHCQAAADRKLLKLPPPPRHGGLPQRNDDFYLAFGRAYTAARAMGSQPGKLMREANDWLTESRCRDYVRRARELGALDGVNTDADATAVHPGTETVLPVVTPDIRMYARAGATLNCELFTHTRKARTNQEARDLMRSWVDAGLAEYIAGDTIALTAAGLAGQDWV